MPRDEHVVVEPHEVTLPAGRHARAVAADSAGEVRLWVVDGDPIGKLAMLGWITREEHEAALVIACLFQETGLRERLGSRYDGVCVDGGGADGGSALERMDRRAAKAWRRLHGLLSAAPLCTRAEVEACALWGLRPISVGRLRVGLMAVAAAIARGR